MACRKILKTTEYPFFKCNGMICDYNGKTVEKYEYLTKKIY